MKKKEMIISYQEKCRLNLYKGKLFFWEWASLILYIYPENYSKSKKGNFKLNEI